MTFSVPAADRATAVEELRTRAFPAQRVRTGTVASGPAHHWAELSRTPVWDGDVADRAAADERAAAERLALSRELAARWEAEPQTVGLGSLALREAEGEEPAEPWRLLGRSVPDVDLWHMDGRWIAIGVSGLPADHERVLVAVVTGADPP
ncbi:hypothetical protein AB0910_18005 [Streptomyces sp. NPDC047002]|uniref:hypothetical protein n=1 Tax=Streptomyces sp. NPDC047002 TaxID=3155475 RepID=UPI0034557833